jgi:hypothetical protein
VLPSGGMRSALLLAAVAAAAVTATTAVGAANARPALRLLDRTPLTVAGKGFAAQEAVRVRVATQGRTTTRRVVASATGSFRARFALSLGRCQSFSLQAFGSTGSRATLLMRSLAPDCNPND